MARGRTRVPAFVLRLFYFYASISFAMCGDHGIPIEVKLWDSGRTPLAHMVDITNEFGLKVLAEHNFLNDNNIAFSPYGLMGILVALYEGVDGESSYQIQRGMQLPWNRNVMRIGFRDIHRTLKTYFVPEEGFLAGLALNNENVTFNESYKKILRFYGFDLENDSIPTSIPESNNTVNMSTTTERSPNMATTADCDSTTASTTESVTGREDPTTISTKEETTTNPDAETITDIDPRGQTSESTTSSAASNSESTTPLTIENTAVQLTSTEQSSISSVTTVQVTSTNQMTTPTPSNAESTTVTAAEAAAETIDTSTVTSVTVDNESLSTRELPSTPTTDPTADVSETATVPVITSERSPMSTITTQITGSEATNTVTETSQTESITTVATEGMSTVSTTSSALETLERRKRSAVDYIYKNPPITDDYLIYRSFEIPHAANQDLNMFLVNGLRNVQVTYMQYDTVLEHAYLPHLEASALRLPLDSDRYYLLAVLPARGGAPALDRLLARLARESDLSDVYAALRPRRVRAILPSFTVKGHVTLTTDLQKLGIRDVFEPRQRDFTPMTRQPGVYVRSVEQAVSVAIRKYQPDDQKKNRYVSNRNRVHFSATYPFLYFVMDSNINVALMAGKMVDPLNTRIL